jgi:hypothetical protein
MYYSVEPWLFLTVINQQQGLSSFSAKWLGVSYLDSMSNSDMAVIQYQGDVYIYDVYSIGSSVPLNDTDYTVNPGSYDLIKVNGGYSASAYLIASYSRKYVTGDLNRDTDLSAGNNTFCFVAGEAIIMTNNSYNTSLACIDFSLSECMTSTFRDPTQNNSNGVINYTQPTNVVDVILSKGTITVGILMLLLTLV